MTFIVQGAKGAGDDAVSTTVTIIGNGRIYSIEEFAAAIISSE